MKDNKLWTDDAVVDILTQTAALVLLLFVFGEEGFSKAALCWLHSSTSVISDHFHVTRFIMTGFFVCPSGYLYLFCLLPVYRPLLSIKRPRFSSFIWFCFLPDSTFWPKHGLSRPCPFGMTRSGPEITPCEGTSLSPDAFSTGHWTSQGANAVWTNVTESEGMAATLTLEKSWNTL